MGLPGDPQKFINSIDSMIKSLCPGAISLNVSRFDSRKEHADPAVYEADINQLKVTKSSAFIRESYEGEWDYTPSSSFTVLQYALRKFQKIAFPKEVMRSVSKFIPKLWTLVTDCGNGVLHLTSFYRGPAMWKVAERDGRLVAVFDSPEAFSEVLKKAQACEGIDVASWKQFCQKFWDASVIDAADTQDGNAIN